jgi:general secretion pathway protein D
MSVQQLFHPNLNHLSFKTPVQVSRALRVLLAMLLTFGGLFSPASLAAPYPVKIELVANGFRIRAETSIRFYVDYSTRTIILPEAQLEGDSPYLEGAVLQKRDDGLLFQVPVAFTITLSPDGKVLTLLRETPITSTTPTDERIPTMFYLSNANPTQVAGLLTRLYPGLKVEVDERQRAIIVLLNPSDRVVVETIIKQLDAPRPQVMFEAEIIEINRTLSQQLGIDYQRLVNLNFRFNESTPPTGAIGVQPFTRSPISLELGIKLLKSNGAARTLARPRVATMDGLEARLNATQTQPIKTVGQSGSISVTNITTGINLRMLPKVSPDQYIESQLSIAVSSPTGFTEEGLPTYSTREANTTVRVRNGEQIVIGGLIESRRSTSDSGIPGLMDLPIVGNLFKNTNTVESDTDLLIIVTPYIVGSPNPSEPTTPAPSSPTTPGEGQP